MQAATAFGLIWRSDVPLEHFAAAPDGAAEPDVTLQLVASLVKRPAGRVINRGQVFTDGFRFTWNDIATFDVFGGNRIDVLPLPGWTGTLPWPFYSTVTALLLAWRGNVPLHACAVEIAGKALLLCGPSGAGKSTLCAALVANGARLLSDDLTVIRSSGSNQPPEILPGRPGIRLLPAIAMQLRGAVIAPIDHDPRDKVMAIWPRGSAGAATAIRAVVLLQDQSAPVTPAERFASLRQQLFRPQWLKVMPHVNGRFLTLTAMLGAARIFTNAPLGPFDSADVSARVMALIKATADS